MTLRVKDGTWKPVLDLWVMDGGTWKRVSVASVRDTTWKMFYGFQGWLDPDGDIETTGWTSTPLYQKLDEGSPGDDATTEITSGTVTVLCPSTTDHDFEIRLANPTSEPSGYEAMSVRVRAHVHEVVGLTITKTLRIQLKQGAAVIATQNFSMGTTYATHALTLSQGEKDSITDYDDLRVNVRTRVCVESPGDSAHSHVTWIGMKIF